ncbi:MAG: DsbA family protein [Methylobacter sp.]
MVTTLYYIHDPMCSWCYAFDSSFTALQKELPDFIRIKKIVGGLAPDTTNPMPVELQQKIQQTWRRIEQTVPNMKFNYDFWMINTPVRSTYPACRAVLAARQQGDDVEDKMIGAIQTAYYQKAKNPSLESTLLECALEVGLDANRFADDLTSSEIDEEFQNELRIARKLGVISYPSLLLEQNGRLFPITVDYLDHETMIREIVSILDNPPAVSC